MMGSLAIEKSAIKLVILLTLITITVFAASYLYYTINISLMGEELKIAFYRWSDGRKVSRLSLLYNIYPDITLRVKNASYGIINSLNEEKTVYFWIESISNREKIRSITINIISPEGDTVASYEWWGGALGEETAVPVVMQRNTVYTLEFIITGSSTVEKGDLVSISIMLMVPTT